MNVITAAQKAKRASRTLRTTSESARNQVLGSIARNLLEQVDSILEANRQDVELAAEAGMSAAFVDRLRLTEARVRQMAEGVQTVAALPDPLGRILEQKELKNGVHLLKKTAPMGVIGIIFESRPNVAADCAALCLKAGSACLLKGGKESFLSCRAIVEAIQKALREYDLPETAVTLLANPTREETAELMACREYVDLLIPRGSSRLINAVVRQAKVPVIETGAGVCHTFVDASADFDMAERIIVNAKCSRPSVCNAMETLLVHADIANAFLPQIICALRDQKVVIHADKAAQSIDPALLPADDASFSTEYNDLEMNLAIVPDVHAAISHIERFGTHHSDCIVSETPENVLIFFNEVDSACVYHNASTRFTDGGEFGKGAEIGISTQKLHARGPMGLEELVTYVYYLSGNGEVRS